MRLLAELVQTKSRKAILPADELPATDMRKEERSKRIFSRGTRLMAKAHIKNPAFLFRISEYYRTVIEQCWLLAEIGAKCIGFRTEASIHCCVED